MLKGALLKEVSSAVIVDISHDIQPFNILHGGQVLKNCYTSFPEGTFHLVGVNTAHEENMRHLVIQHQQYTFIGPDNGLFGLLWSDSPPAAVFSIKLLEEEKRSTFPMKDVYVRVLKHLSGGGKVDEVAAKVSSYRMSAIGRPIVQQDFIKGAIIYFDRFENAIINITKEEFERVRNERRFVVHFKRYDDIDTISEHYYDVPESEKLCLFNSSGLLEIAINKGNAMGLLNLNTGDIVQVEFR
jgi:S-adenosylmethionine hydrolase